MDSTPSTSFQRLIVTPPPSKPASFWGKSAPAWGKIIPVLQKHLPAPPSHAYDTWITFIAPGLPFHLPFSLTPAQAQALSADLKKVNCQVRIVAE